MRHTFLVVTVKVVKIGVHLRKLPQNLNRRITSVDHCRCLGGSSPLTSALWMCETCIFIIDDNMDKTLTKLREIFLHNIHSCQQSRNYDTDYDWLVTAAATTTSITTTQRRQSVDGANIRSNLPATCIYCTCTSHRSTGAHEPTHSGTTQACTDRLLIHAININKSNV